LDISKSSNVLKSPKSDTSDILGMKIAGMTMTIVEDS
jgi:hypothetical protein